jgi:hypothetical protein
MRSSGSPVLLLLPLALSAAPPASAQGLHLLPGVEEVASDTIGDIAVAAVELPHPVIFYNPGMTRRYGPLLTRFFIAHEYGHIFLRHTRAEVNALPEPARDSAFQANELDADCYAASQVDPSAREATEAAVRFFARLGPFRFDAEHPTGAQRAARILTCLPGEREPARYARGETGVEMGPVSGEPEPAPFEVVPSRPGEGYGGQAVLWVDGRRVGSVSNMHLAEPLRVDGFGAGIHSYRVVLDVYGLDGELQFNANGSVTGRGQFLIRSGARFRINWAPGSAPALIQDPEPARAP